MTRTKRGQATPLDQAEPTMYTQHDRDEPLATLTAEHAANAAAQLCQIETASFNQTLKQWAWVINHLQTNAKPATTVPNCRR